MTAARKPAKVASLPPGPVLPELRATVTRIDEALADPKLKGTAKASLLRARVDTLHRIAVLQGEAEISPAQIMRSKAWVQIRAALDKVAEEHPEAGRAFAEALGVFDA